jgi:hypothetical protein
MEKLDTMYRPQHTTVGYCLDTHAMTVSLLQYKRDQTPVVIESWLTLSMFHLLQGAELCGKLESASNWNRWIRPYFFSVQNTIQAALMTKEQPSRLLQAPGHPKGASKVRTAQPLGASTYSAHRVVQGNTSLAL